MWLAVTQSTTLRLRLLKMKKRVDINMAVEALVAHLTPVRFTPNKIVFSYNLHLKALVSTTGSLRTCTSVEKIFTYGNLRCV